MRSTYITQKGDDQLVNSRCEYTRVEATSEMLHVNSQLKTLAAAVANKVAPTAQAMEKATGVNPTHDPDGKSRGLLEDLGHKVEQSFEAVNYRRHHSPIAAPSTQHAAQAGEAAENATPGFGNSLPQRF